MPQLPRLQATRRSLPKWPALVVVGDAVTKEQAAEILIRTDNWNLSTNDKAWARRVYAAAGLPPSSDDWRGAKWEDIEALRTRTKNLDLEYLNNARIASCWVGGPKGWCDWDGTIGCANYNIGKWPSVETVIEEWERIADAFPFLCLRSQLFDHETCEEEARPVVEFRVAEGRVSLFEPEDPLEIRETPLRVLEPNGERGCSIETLRWALSVVEVKP